MTGETSTEETKRFTSTWQYIRDGSIICMGILSIIMQSILIGKLDEIYAGSGIWFGIVAILSGSCAILAYTKRKQMLGWMWLFLATATMFVAIGPMYYSALGWVEASVGTNDDSRLKAALSGVLFFCGLISAIFSLFAACSASLIIAEMRSTQRQRRSPGSINVVQYN